MIGILAMLAALIGRPTPQGQSPAAAESAFVGVSAPRERYFERESIRLRLRVGFEREFLSKHVVALFQQELDMPARVEWPEALDGARELETKPSGEVVMRSFVLNDRVARGDGADLLVETGAMWTTVELERAFVAERAGELVVPAPRMHFAFASRFEEDFVHGRVPQDRREATVEGEALRLRIEPLPSAGRPPEFVDAIGRFSMTATADPRELSVGDGLRVELRIEGEGNFETLTPPRLDRMPGLQLRGAIEERSATACVVTYDLYPTSPRLREVPAIALAYFDPTPPEGYSTIWSKPIPLTVHSPHPTEPEPEWHQVSGGHSGGGIRAKSGVYLLLALGGLVLALVVAVAWWLIARKK